MLHRQLQQLDRRLSWQLPVRVSGLLSWMGTFATISLGFILFRANSIAQATAMLRTALTPARLSASVVPTMLYAIVLFCFLGYFTYTAVRSLFRRYIVGLAIPVELRLVLYAAALYVGILHFAETQSFVYLQF